jgi:hypothetical protein
MVKWVKDNPWYTEDPELRLIADGMADRVRSELPQATPKQFLSELARRVKALKPSHPAFENPNRDAEASVVTESDEAPPPKNRRGGKKTFDDLPKDAQEAAKRLERTHGISRADYLANYEW